MCLMLPCMYINASRIQSEHNKKRDSSVTWDVHTPPAICLLIELFPISFKRLCCIS